jgi:chemosensory pili system protein ChpA (sensor histidine kinase/response regulator)
MSKQPSHLEIQNATRSRGVAAGLHWVRNELNENLQHASQLVELHSENRKDPGSLNKALHHLHEVRGAAVLIQAYGLALLAEEMKQTVQDLGSGMLQEADPAYSAVVGACVQATDYLDVLQSGHSDSALVLQPIVNELRLARGKSLLTEDDLFVAQFRVLGLHLDRTSGGRSDADAQTEAGRLHPVFAASLLSWFKDQDSVQALSRIGRIAEILADASRERALHQLWRTAAACVEALLSRALDDTLELKRQFGRAGQLMKILAEVGEAGAVKQMSDVSLRLLFYAGRSSCTGPRVTSLRRALQLDTWLPSLEVVQGCRARLRGASTGLLVRVAEELRSDLAEVRDSIDVALRAGASREEFESTAQLLKRVADTLLVLGLSAESQALAQPVETLRDAGESDPAAWMEFATAVLQVDLSLEAALYRQLQPAPSLPDSQDKPPVLDLREGTAALLRESLVNLARVKTYVEAYIKTDDVFGLPDAARMLDEIAAGFRMLSMERAEELVLDVLKFVQSTDFPQVRESNTSAGRFADAIAAIEYYIEMRRDGLPGSDGVLEKLGKTIAQLRTPPILLKAAPPVEPVPEPEVSDQSAIAAPSVADAAVPFELAIVEYKALAKGNAPAPEPPAPIVTPEFHLIGEPLPEPKEIAATQPVHTAEPTAADTGQSPAVAAQAPVAKLAAADVDPEIREVFIEEAEEVLQTLQRAVPRWLRHPDERDVLGTIRRAFHTLKGSGRMVGAVDIGELSWAVESMLNRCLDRTIVQSQAVRDAVREAVVLVPAMIAAFRDNTPPPEQATRLAEQARRLAAGNEADDETDLISVFRSDATVRLQMVSRWLEDQDRSVGEYGIPEPVVRAFHTLRGAAMAIGAKPIGELSGSLENYLDVLHRSHMPLNAAGIVLIDDCCNVLGQWIRRLGEASASSIDARPWLDRVEAIRAGADRESGETDEDHQLAEVFAFEALDLVQRFESDLRAWAKSPQSPGYVHSLKTTIHTLKGAAGMAHCAPIAAVAQALNLRLASMSDAPPPSELFFAVMGQVVEGLYTQLDQFRDGKLGGDGSEWLSIMSSLDDATPVPEGAPADPGPSGFTPAQNGEPDRELVEIFLQEGEELVDEIERASDAIAAKPDDPVLLGAWLRALHTLKGSARVSGMDGIGDVAHRLETATELARDADEAGRERFRARLRVAVDGLQELIDEARRGERGAAARILARFEDVGATPVLARQASEDGFELIDLSEADLPAVDTPANVPGAGSLEEFEAAWEAASAAEVPLPATEPDEFIAGPVDQELVAIFLPEAGELLESLGNLLSQWRDQPDNPQFPREMQRDLHTFKGGARMAGLSVLGDAAHDLETRLDQLERDGLQAQSWALDDIAAGLDKLYRLREMSARKEDPIREMTGEFRDTFVAENLPEPVQEPLAPAQPEPFATQDAESDYPFEPVLAPLEPVADIESQPETAAEPVEPAQIEEIPAAVDLHSEWNPELFWKPEEAAAASEARREAVRVPVERLDTMLNQAGEISIYRSRLEENHATLGSSLAEMAQTITRVREQLRLMEVETEAQIAARGFSRGDDDHRYDSSQFDALEMDRYSRMQELSRALAESVSDMSSLHASLDTSSTEAEGLLIQQGRINTEVQQALMGTLMVPFSRQVQRLSRVVRQTAEQNGKRARTEFEGAESELDRNVLERMTAPLEHLLRNCVVHGIEDVDARQAAGKDPEGVVQVSLKREGSQLLIEVRDDGRGLDFEAIRAQAVKRGLMRTDAQVSNDDLARFVFAAGFSTARTLTQDAGRGIGMDVVAAEVKQLGGTVDIASETGRGVRFRIRLPLMLAVSQALVVQVGDELFAIPLGAVEGIARTPREGLADMMKEGGKPLEYGGNQYQVRRLGELVGLPAPTRIDSRTVPAILMRLGDGLGGSERRVAVVAERLIGNREIVTKPAGPMLGSVAGVSGATILADGRVMLIVDIPALIGEATRRRLGDEAASAPIAAPEAHRLIMVVDDSITIRRVTERLLTRKGYRVITIKDGLDAMASLQTETPDAVLLDIEMPRADGFEVAAFIRNTPRIARLPIIMITSRSGDKHREHARSLGVNRYLIKPYQEDQLLAELRALLAAEETETA